MKDPARYGRLALAALGIGIFAVVVTLVGPARMLGALKQAQGSRILAGAGLVMGVWTLRLVRWYLLLSAVGGRVSIVQLLTGYFLGAAMGTLTPARLGELSASGMAGRAAGFGSAQGYSAIAVDRALDLTFLAAGGAIGAAYLSSYGLASPGVRHVAIGAASVLALLSLLLLAGVAAGQSVARAAGAIEVACARRPALAWAGRLAGNLSSSGVSRLHESARLLARRGRVWVPLLLLVAATVALQAATYACLAKSVLHSSWGLIMACAIIGTAVGQASLLPGGAGAGGAAFVGAAVGAGCDPGEAAAGAAVAALVPVAFLWTAAVISLGARMAAGAQPAPVASRLRSCGEGEK